jgi:hypothetical protein
MKAKLSITYAKDILRIPYRAMKKQLRWFKVFYWALLNLAYRLNFLSVYRIPVIINNFNRLTYPQQLIAFLEQCGFVNIVILDNDSKYQPLLDYYKNCRHNVVKLGKNYGHLALWKSALYKRYRWNYFIYTDPDVLPVERCPLNFIEYFKSVLDKTNALDKVGFGIKIDDLPDWFRLKAKTIDHEKKFWTTEVEPGVYEAQIDTTFALYKPFTGLKFGEVHTLAAYRFGAPYMVRHLPWYTDSANLSEEEQYYLKMSNASSSIATNLRSINGLN